MTTLINFYNELKQNYSLDSDGFSKDLNETTEIIVDFNLRMIITETEKQFGYDTKREGFKSFELLENRIKEIFNLI